MDPASDPDPAPAFSSVAASIDVFFPDYCWKVHLRQFSNIKSRKEVKKKIVEIKVFLTFLLVDGKIRIRIQIRIRTDNPDPGDPVYFQRIFWTMPRRFFTPGLFLPVHNEFLAFLSLSQLAGHFTSGAVVAHGMRSHMNIIE